MEQHIGRMEVLLMIKSLTTMKPSVQSPCPMMLFRMKEKNGEYYCKGCQKEIIDFRDKSLVEIKAACTKDICGIFNNHQVNKVRRPFTYHLKYMALVVLSFFGFNVAPLRAQSTPSKKQNISLIQRQTVLDQKDYKPGVVPAKSSEHKSTKKKIVRRKKTLKFRTVGCPSF
jgi:hypothetical protein